MIRRLDSLGCLSGTIGCLVALAVVLPTHQEVSAAPAAPAAPWLVGPAHARYTITEFGDLECSYCRAYTPELLAFIQSQPDVNLQWHHFPLEPHGQVAVHEARLAQCAGQLGGRTAFWQAIEQLLSMSTSPAEGASDLQLEGVDLNSLHECARRDIAVAHLVERQRLDAVQRGIRATPSLEITDNTSGRSVKLEGPVDAATLLSAMDWFAHR